MNEFPSMLSPVEREVEENKSKRFYRIALNEQKQEPLALQREATGNGLRPLLEKPSPRRLGWETASLNPLLPRPSQHMRNDCDDAKSGSSHEKSLCKVASTRIASSKDFKNLPTKTSESQLTVKERRAARRQRIRRQREAMADTKLEVSGSSERVCSVWDSQVSAQQDQHQGPEWGPSLSNRPNSRRSERRANAQQSNAQPVCVLRGGDAKQQSFSEAGAQWRQWQQSCKEELAQESAWDSSQPAYQ
jgi:hypothetical protein